MAGRPKGKNYSMVPITLPIPYAEALRAMRANTGVPVSVLVSQALCLWFNEKKISIEIKF